MASSPVASWQCSLLQRTLFSPPCAPCAPCALLSGGRDDDDGGDDNEDLYSDALRESLSMSRDDVVGLRQNEPLQEPLRERGSTSEVAGRGNLSRSRNASMGGGNELAFLRRSTAFNIRNSIVNHGVEATARRMR